MEAQKHCIAFTQLLGSVYIEVQTNLEELKVILLREKKINSKYRVQMIYVYALLYKYNLNNLSTPLL